MKNKYCLIDFEYKGSPEVNFPLVSCAFHLMPENTKHFFWLYKDESTQEKLKKFLESIKDRIHVAFNVSGAEALCYINLGLNPIDFKWIDIQLEWRQLTNSWDEYAAGEQLVAGKVKTVPPFLERAKLKPEKLDKIYGKGKRASEPDKSLVAATFKLLGIKSDLFYKNKMRDLIIYTENFTEKDIKAIKEYNMSDIDEMWKLLQKIEEAEFHPTEKESDIVYTELSEMLFRGSVGAATAKMMSYGYPVARKKLENLRDNVPYVTNEVCEDILSQGFEFFNPNKTKEKKEQGFKYSKNTKAWKAEIEKSPYIEKWKRTPTGAVKMGKDDIANFYPHKYEFPRNNPYAQMIRFLSLESNLKGLTPTAKGSFFDSVGSDDRSRPFLNPYGSQTGRWQPKATHFMFLKTAWMRGLVHPRPEKMLYGIDYSSQEILVAACLSEDENLLKAYKSGDIYMYYGKAMKYLPKEATKASHPKERAVCKSAVLGIQYGMGAESLGRQLTETSEGEKVFTAREAQGFIDGFYSAFSDYAEFKERCLMSYEHFPLELHCGWKLYPDNASKNSVLNFPVQGTASSILRTAVVESAKRDVKLMFPLHDALYGEADLGDIEAVELTDKIMKDACVTVLGPEGRHMRTDVDVWGDGVLDLKEKMPSGWNIYKEYIDARGKKELEMYKKYLTEVFK